MLRITIGYAVGIVAAFLLGSMLGTQVVLASVQSMGLEVSWAARVDATLDDVLGLSATLLPLMALVLVVMWGLYDVIMARMRSARGAYHYALVGSLCILALHPLLGAVLDVDVFAATRSWFGLLTKAIEGAFGGWCCGRLRMGVYESNHSTHDIT
jgi:hypothetical protein